jgi:hypothetical protein
MALNSGLALRGRRHSCFAVVLDSNGEDRGQAVRVLGITIRVREWTKAVEITKVAGPAVGLCGKGKQACGLAKIGLWLEVRWLTILLP